MLCCSIAGNKVCISLSVWRHWLFKDTSTKVRDAVNAIVYTTSGDVDSAIASVTQLQKIQMVLFQVNLVKVLFSLNHQQLVVLHEQSLQVLIRSGVVSKIGAGVVGGVLCIYGFVDLKLVNMLLTIQDA